MNNKSFYSPRVRTARLLRIAFAASLAAGCILALPIRAVAGDAPAWMHAVVNAPVPVHDEKTEAVLLYAEEIVNVQSADKIRTTVRYAYKILRPGGRGYGDVAVEFDPRTKITSMKGWCIPAQGKDYEVKEKDAVETSLLSISDSELMNDVKDKILRIPAADPGNVVGFEYETESQPFVLQDSWSFQLTIPVRESHYTLQLPQGWEYKATFLNAPELKPVQAGNQWQWSVNDVKAIRLEDEMPPWSGIAGRMVVSFYPTGGAVPGKTFSDWRQMGAWYADLARGRADPSPEIKDRVTALTAGVTNPADKMRAIAAFVQKEIRYVAIELGIGGWQPHAASEVFAHRYGDCKDKATLLASMLREIVVDSYYVVINSRRGAVTAQTPAYIYAFNHVILAIRLPEGVNDPSLVATWQDPKLGRLLFFDPTNEFTPFGQIGGYLQDNYGLLVTPEGGELVPLPMQAPAMNSLQRTAKLTLDATGTLKGDIKEVRIGDHAMRERYALRNATKESDMVKPIERLLSDSLSSYHLTKAQVINLHHNDQPFGFDYSVEAPNYAKNAGNLFLVRPRVIGVKTSAIMESKEPRKYPIEFPALTRDTDTFEITLPAGFAVDELPPPVDADYGFASYHSKTETSGSVLRYTRTYETKELSVPVSQADEVKKFYRIIASDERNMAVLKPATK